LQNENQSAAHKKQCFLSISNSLHSSREREFKVMDENTNQPRQGGEENWLLALVSRPVEQTLCLLQKSRSDGNTKMHLYSAAAFHAALPTFVRDRPFALGVFAAWAGKIIALVEDCSSLR
jgi:hypothetical protein